MISNDWFYHLWQTKKGSFITTKVDFCTSHVGVTIIQKVSLSIELQKLNQNMYKNFNFLLLSTDYNHSKKFGPTSGPTKCVGHDLDPNCLTPLWYLWKIFLFFFFLLKADDKIVHVKLTSIWESWLKLAGINHHNIYMYQLKHAFYIQHILNY